MRDRIKVLTLAAVMAALLVSAFPAAAQTARVTGVVKDNEDKPIEGATVLAENPALTPSSFTSTTDSRGRFSMLGLRSGDWVITASAPGFQPSSGQVPVRSGSNPPLEFVLMPGAPAAAGAFSMFPRELHAELQAAEDLVSSEQYDAGIAAYQAILAKAPTLTLINLEIGRAYRLKKDYDSALAAYKLILVAEPTNERAKIEIGMTNLEKGDLDAAETALSEAAQGMSASREVFYNLGEVKFVKGETDEAIKWYQRAIDTDPTWAMPVFKLGLSRLQKADVPGAIEMMEKVISLDPASGEAAQAKALIEQLKQQG